MGAEISPVYAPNGSAWMFWTPTSTDVSASDRFTASKHTNGGQMTRTTPATSVAEAMSAASSAASSGVVFIFQFAAMMTSLATEPRLLESLRLRVSVGVQS